MEFFKGIVSAIAVTIVVVLLIFGVSLLGMKSYEYFGPRYENIRRKVFKQTRSYNEGKMQQLAKYRLEYYQADYTGKEILKSTIQHMFADYQSQELPAVLRQFLNEINGGY